ncbi:MAG: ShlB/FhaC/HecB family hemolysin secretion/activation protein [Alphaproteobacteria bacterium]|nr:MAG: ShlB/FhaC/HecB family hemolysin secretion/activation protein [Alphaproteobacteria bacterium]
MQALSPRWIGPLAALVLAPVLAPPAAAQQRLPAPVERPPAPPTTEPLVIPTIGFELPAGLAPPPGLAEDPVLVRRLVIRGVERLDPGDVRAATDGIVGATVPLARIYQVAATLTQRARARGQFLTTVFVPDQIAEDGTFEVTVLEGRLSRIDVTGAPPGLTATLRRIAAPLLAAPPRLSDVERVLLLIRELPGVDVRATLQPLSTTGEELALVLATTPKPLTGAIGIDTRGSKYSGPGRGSLELNAGSILGYGEVVRLRGLATTTLSEQRYGAMDISVPLSSDGLRLDLSVGQSRSRPGYDLRPFAVRGATEQVDVVLSYPVLLSLSSTLRVTAGAHVLDSRAWLGEQRYYVDRTRSASLGAVWDVSGPWTGATRLAARWVQGLDVGDASTARASSRRDGSATAGRAVAEVWHIQRLADAWTVSFQLEGQYATRGLFAADEYAYGGARFGRGYDPAEVTGDHGAAGGLELSWQVPGLSGETARTTLYGFGDVGAVWDRDRTVQRRIRSSAGVGLRLDIVDALSGFVEYAWPIGPAPAAEAPANSGRAVFGVTVKF